MQTIGDTQDETLSKDTAALRSWMDTLAPDQKEVVEIPENKEAASQNVGADVLASADTSTTQDATLPRDLASAHAAIGDLHARLKSLEANMPIVKTPTTIEQADKNVNSELKYQQEAQKDITSASDKIADAQINQLQRYQNQRQSVYQMAQDAADQQQRALQHVQQMYPYTTPQALESAMSNTEKTLKYIAFAFGAYGSALAGGSNKAMDSYYEQLDRTVKGNNENYQRAVEGINATYGNTIKALDTKLGAINDAININAKQFQAIDGQFQSALNQAKTHADAVNITQNWFTSRQTIKNQQEELDLKRQELLQNKTEARLKLASNPNAITVPTGRLTKDGEMETETLVAQDPEARKQLASTVDMYVQITKNNQAISDILSQSGVDKKDIAKSIAQINSELKNGESSTLKQLVSQTDLTKAASDTLNESLKNSGIKDLTDFGTTSDKKTYEALKFLIQDNNMTSNKILQIKRANTVPYQLQELQKKTIDSSY